MSRPIRTLVAIDSGLSRESVASSLPHDAGIELVGVVEGTDEAWRTLQDANIDVLAIACVGYSDRVLFLIESSVRQDPTRPVIVLNQGSTNGFVRRVFEVGADDILALPAPPEAFVFAIQKGLARKQSHRASTRVDRAKLIVVLGPKGGTGKTLTASNLAVCLQQAGERVALVDLDLQFGDVALSMGLSPERTIHDLVLSAGTLDAEKLEDFLTVHSSGVKALLAPSRPDYAGSVTVELLRDVYAILREQYDVVVVDTPPGFTPEVIASIDVSTNLVMVGMLDSLSLKNTKLGLETLNLMGYEPENVKLVLNRAGTRVGITHGDVETVLGRVPDVLVPSDREIPRAVNEGVPITIALPQSEASQAFKLLAAFFVEAAATGATAETLMAAGSEPRRRIFGKRG
jgi:pilus assembly protein CpaE